MYLVVSNINPCYRTVFLRKGWKMIDIDEITDKERVRKWFEKEEKRRLTKAANPLTLEPGLPPGEESKKDPNRGFT